MKDLGKLKSLLSELTACVEAMEMGGEKDMDHSPEGEKEETEDDGDDVAMKSLKMKLGKYKDIA